jgi:hypothetical protein
LAAEAKAVGGISIGKMDLEDLQARAVQLFQIADTYPAYVTDRIEPEIHLSPTSFMRLLSSDPLRSVTHENELIPVTSMSLGSKGIDWSILPNKGSARRFKRNMEFPSEYIRNLQMRQPFLPEIGRRGFLFSSREPVPEI